MANNRAKSYDERLSEILRAHLAATNQLVDRLRLGACNGKGLTIQAKESAILLAALTRYIEQKE